MPLSGPIFQPSGLALGCWSGMNSFLSSLPSRTRTGKRSRWDASHASGCVGQRATWTFGLPISLQARTPKLTTSPGSTQDSCSMITLPQRRPHFPSHQEIGTTWCTPKTAGAAPVKCGQEKRTTKKQTKPTNTPSTPTDFTSSTKKTTHTSTPQPRPASTVSTPTTTHQNN